MAKASSRTAIHGAAARRKAAPKRATPASRQATASRPHAPAQVVRRHGPSEPARRWSGRGKSAAAGKPAAAQRGRAGTPLTFRFAPGDRVRTRQDTPAGHCRTPFYLRGQPGVVERRLGHFRNPQELAYGRPGLPRQALYQVRYALSGLWGESTASSQDTVLADIFEFWLNPA